MMTHLVHYNSNIDWVEPKGTRGVVFALRCCPDARLGDGDGLPLLLLLQAQHAAGLRVLRQELCPACPGQIILVTLLLVKLKLG